MVVIYIEHKYKYLLQGGELQPCRIILSVNTSRHFGTIEAFYAFFCHWKMNAKTITRFPFEYTIIGINHIDRFWIS